MRAIRSLLPALLLFAAALVFAASVAVRLNHHRRSPQPPARPVRMRMRRGGEILGASRSLPRYEVSRSSARTSRIRVSSSICPT
jgi:hypothetical protein